MREHVPDAKRTGGSPSEVAFLLPRSAASRWAAQRASSTAQQGGSHSTDPPARHHRLAQPCGAAAESTRAAHGRPAAQPAWPRAGVAERAQRAQLPGPAARCGGAQGGPGRGQLRADVHHAGGGLPGSFSQRAARAGARARACCRRGGAHRDGAPGDGRAPHGAAPGLRAALRADCARKGGPA